ncbi:MAG: hypothetical protein GWP03_05850 [Proteobacteria bacterium]|nr:hypothetical protein [Pseudomonadota bacterium]
MKRIKSRIISNKPLSPDLFLLTFTSSGVENEVLPGNFINIEVTKSLDPFLRRPFSIFDVSEGTISVLYRVIGRGTEIMKELKPDKQIDFIGPLGNSYPISESDNFTFVAGGTGIASIHYLLKTVESSYPNSTKTLYWGAKNRYDFVLRNEIEDLCTDVLYTTEKGDLGNKGFVTDFIDIKNKTTIYACGPTPMLKSLHDKTEGILSYYSFEERMACGVGVCLGCAIMTKSGKYKYVCKDGPVFRGDEIF